MTRPDPDPLTIVADQERPLIFLAPDPRDSDPLYVPEDVLDLLWDPRKKVFVPRPRSPLLPMFLSAVAGAVLASLVWAAVTRAALPSAPQPEPSFVVPTTPRNAPDVAPTHSGASPELLHASASSAAPASAEAAERTAAPTPRPKPAPVPTTHVRTGTATWYDDPRKSGFYAAAGPPLRVGNWRGRTVTVSAGGHSFRVVLSDWCACRDRLIDLSPAAFSRLADLSRGIVTVRVSW